MSASRVAVWIVVAAAGGAWLASAAGVTRQARTARAFPAPPEGVQLDALAADVQAQAGRLRERLAKAPAPRETLRNPFNFSARPERRRIVPPAAVPSPVSPQPLIAEIPEPVLELIGVAETKKAGGVVRTAMITGGYGELMMVTAGQRILSRYDVVVVDADTVELKDLHTGGLRRLVLR